VLVRFGFEPSGESLSHHPRELARPLTPTGGLAAWGGRGSIALIGFATDLLIEMMAGVTCCGASPRHLLHRVSVSTPPTG